MSDNVLSIITHDACVKHDMGNNHPESPQRLQAIANALNRSNLEYNSIQAPLATKEQLQLAHDSAYIEQIFVCNDGNYHRLDPDTILTPFTLEAALRAAGAAVHAVDLVMQNKANFVFCSMRPPGHHAEVAQAMGFCFFNNIAIAAKYAEHNYGLTKILIVDFDVHHGNGTQAIVEGDERILFLSSYQDPLYPGRFSHEGKNIKHLRLNPGDGSKQFRTRVTAEWLPIITKYQPDLLLFSAGFDAHKLDPLAQLNFETEDYFWITSEVLNAIAWPNHPKVISCLEGGYNIEVLGESVISHLQAIRINC